MLAPLRQVLGNPLNVFGIACMLVLILFHEPTSMYYYLTIAQLVYVPIIVQRLLTLHTWQRVLVYLGQFATTSLYFVDNTAFSIMGASVYLMSTLAICWCGVQRFLQRGFTNTAEMMIDIGLIYIAMGGIWFFAHITGMDTGFSPIITWLTAIHFHYSAFILCTTVGLVGRLHSSRLFSSCAIVIALGPMLVALGITFSPVIEIVSVSLYVVAIFSLTIYLFQIHLQPLASFFIRTAFLTLCFTIIWSFLYAYSNLTNSGLVDIPSMLDFHGILNCILFGGAITFAWSIYVPPTTHHPFTFPISKIRGHIRKELDAHHALVDDMSVFIDKTKVPSRISDFYENTIHYELTASVRWSGWFKPLAFIYQFISRKMGQLNLPFSSKAIKMDGTITKISEELDGRSAPRVWQRQANGKTIFSAIYAIHTDNHRTYMNIALPLPKASMHGILTLHVANNKLYLTSDDVGDAGTYLSIGHSTFKLPLHEYFTIWEENDQLLATHKMTLLGIRFLTISYWIK